MSEITWDEAYKVEDETYPVPAVGRIAEKAAEAAEKMRAAAGGDDGVGDPPVAASGVDWEDMRIGGGGRGGDVPKQD